MPLRIIINACGGNVQDVFCSDADAHVTLLDWDTQESDPSAPFLVEITTDENVIERPFVADFRVSRMDQLAGTLVERALRAAGVLP